MQSDSQQNAGADWRWPDSLDALLAASAYHALLLENDQVRVVETRIPPGHTVPVHTHRWPGVMFVRQWSDLLRRDPDGTVTMDTRQRFAQPPAQDAAMWQAPLPPHSVENIGDEEWISVQVELKGP